MSAVLGWFKDPYVHMILVGVVLAQLAVGNHADETIDSAREPIACQVCNRVISKPGGHMHYVARADVAPQRD